VKVQGKNYLMIFLSSSSKDKPSVVASTEVQEYRMDIHQALNQIIHLQVDLLLHTTTREDNLPPTPCKPLIVS
jgi:hypothetical protein